MKVAELIDQHRETGLAERGVPNLEPVNEEVDYSHPVESPRARQAFEDYWALGPSRTTLKLHEHYISDPSAKVPTRQITTLRRWCHIHNWQDRCMARIASQSEQTEAAVVEERANQKRARIAEAQGMRSVGRQIVTQMITRIKQGDLAKMELLPHVEIVDGKPKRYPGLMDFSDKALRLIDIGQKLERQETGEEVEGKFEALIELLIADMPPEEQREIRLYAALVMERGKK